jgi:hypothetical protein
MTRCSDRPLSTRRVKSAICRLRPWRGGVVVLLAVALSASSGAVAGAPSLRLGVTHTQNSLNPGGAPTALAAGRALLAASPSTLQNQHLMGWGASNPEPAPGIYDWASLDRRMALIRDTGGTPVITLCCAPDWMKGGLPGLTDWSRLEAAPWPQFFGEFARLSAEVARRYPDVRHFQVWNEMKGFWDSAKNRWRYEDYTALYNEVYRALKGVNPEIKVGGPYVHMNSLPPGSGGGRDSAVFGPWGMVDQRDLDVISYWLDHAEGADFIAVDGGAALRSGAFLVPPTESAEKFAAINRWIRDRTPLPIWWSELYPIPFDQSSSYASEADIWASAMDTLAASGASVALYWQPEGSSTHTGLWTAPTSPSGGQATVVHEAVAPWLG